MTAEYPVPQLLIHRGVTDIAIVARSEGIAVECEEFALKAAIAFGPISLADVFQSSVFAAANYDVVVIVTATAVHDGSHAIVFRALFVPRAFYALAEGDCFAIADRFPVNIHARGPLPLLDLAAGGAILSRRVADLQSILKGGDSAFLLGAAQALVDGVKIRVRRDAMPERLARNVWQLLPVSTRMIVFPCEYCLTENAAFHWAALPEVPAKLPPGFLHEEQVKDYPDGRYERALQVAIEDGDQRALDKLLARPSSRDVLRLTLLGLAAFFTVWLLTRLI
jgi:hypothetical protein